VGEFGWPSRGRGDFGRENNEMERLLIEHWGQGHRAYLRGRSVSIYIGGNILIWLRSLHNIRIERLWRDVRKDSLESYRQIFTYLSNSGLLDMENEIHRSCLFLVFQPRIQASLNRTRDAWNHHKVRTARNKTPIAMFELSREAAIRRGYWTGDMGDDLATATNPLYGYDGEAPLPPVADHHGEPDAVSQEPDGIAAEREAGICINDDDDLQDVRELMPDFDFDSDDENWGIDVYCQAVIVLTGRM
jgi:hypothetical protein